MTSRGSTTIWERLDECVSTLSEPFRASEVVGWFRRHYPETNETSLRTHIQFATSNVDNRGTFATRDPLITRIGHGVYVRAKRVPLTGQTTARAALHAHEVQALPAEPAERKADALGGVAGSVSEWHTEANVVSLLVRHLALTGWSLRSVADTASRAHGVDIVAERGDLSVGIEVKGYPSRNYADPARAGQRKPTQPPSQARVWYASAILSGMTLRTKQPDLRSVLAFPDFPTYRSLFANTAASLEACHIEVWWVAEDGTVEVAQG